MMRTKWSSLALLSVLSLAGIVAGASHASAEPLRAEQSFQAGRIAQQRSGAMDRREPVRAPQVRKVDDRSPQRDRAEFGRQPPQRQRAAKVDKRR